MKKIRLGIRTLKQLELKLFKDEKILDIRMKAEGIVKL